MLTTSKATIAVLIQLLIQCSNGTGHGIKFILEPQDTIVPTGGSGILNCAAKGSSSGSMPKISWKKDGSLISFVGDTRSEEEESYFKRSILANGSLQITSFLRSRESRPDEGLYQCFVTSDGIGSIISRSAKLQAASLSRFDEEPEDISVALGQTARFSCYAQGIPPPIVAWFKDNHPLTLDLSRMTVLPSGSLEISHVQEIDQGTYHCNISNVEKFAASRHGRLMLSRTNERDSPPVFTAIPKTQTVIASQPVVLECSAVGHPLPTLTWLKNGKTIDFGTFGNRYSLIGEGNLAISNVEESDKGTIVCRAENHEDSADVSGTLDVHVPPRVLTTQGNFYAYEKEDVELPCKIYGKPPPIIQWYKNGDMIIEGDYFQIVNGNNLKILGCLTSDEAMYQCFGTNPSGNVQASMHLRVLKKGEEMPLLLDYDDDDEFGDDDDVDDDDDMDLELSSGRIGEILPPSTGQGNLTTLGLSSPREVVAVLVSTRFVTLSWKAPVSLNGISGYAVYYKELGSDRERVLNTTQGDAEEVNIQGLQPNKRYTFRVVPYDMEGAGQSSTEITVLTQPEVDVPGQPRFLKAWAVTPTRVDVRWAPPEVTNGHIERYKIFHAEASGQEAGGTDLLTSTEELETGDELDEDEEDYLVPKNGVVQSLTVTSSEASLEDLRIFTEYLIWVVAVNANGPGTNSEQVRVTTFSDSPTDTPHKVTIEAASSTSIVVRWDPPPLEFRNGIITGYKVKYKQKGRKRAETLTPDGNSRFLALNELDRGVEYQVKIAALNVNGTGPFTEWVAATTFPRDLDENRVPEKPSSLVARAGVDSITITWTPPLNSNVVIRGYTIGWGKGIPDVYQKVVDGKKRSFTIEKLQSNYEYVISLRTSNQMGDGVPIYENVRTRESSDELEEDTQLHRFRGPQLATPTGLRATIISPTSVVLSWSDTSLSKNQVVTDRRHYTVRYAPTDSLGLSKPKASYKYHNSTALNTIINNLKPNTLYEFSVRVVKNRLTSEWSLVVMNKTRGNSATQSPTPGMNLPTSDAGPTYAFNPPTSVGSPTHGLIHPTSTGPSHGHTIPQDLTLVAMTGEDESSFVILNWQPPRLGRGDEVRGYLVYYTTNPQRKEWVEEAVPEDVLTHQVSNLSPDTKYFFKMAARLNKTSSSTTEIRSVLTPPVKRYVPGIIPGKPNDSVGKPNLFILYILIGLSITFALGSISLCMYYRKKSGDGSPKQSTLKKSKKSHELKPPDLWIHHDQMELKGVEKGRRSTPLSPSAGSLEFGDFEEKIPLQNTSSLERGSFVPSYSSDNQYQTHSLGRRKAKPIQIPSIFPEFKERNVRTNPPGILPPPQLSEIPGNKPYDSFHSGSSTASSQQNIGNVGSGYSSSDYHQAGGVGNLHGTLGRRSGGAGGNLRSFAVPIPPNPPIQNNLSGTPVNPKIIRPMTSTPHHSHHSSNSNSNIQHNSPIKRISASPIYGNSGLKSLSMSPGLDDGNGSLARTYSTEDLSQEISNLEGLMKDLSAITANEFQC